MLVLGISIKKKEQYQYAGQNDVIIGLDSYLL